MKNQEQIEKRIEKLERRINMLWEQSLDTGDSEAISNKITSNERLIEVLNWVLGKEDIC